MHRDGAGDFRSGFAALIGRPNVGKSSLVNALVGRKISIVSPKPQTTRRRVQAVLNVPGRQAVFVDTPGVQRPKDLLDRAMMRAAVDSLEGVDLVLLVVDASRSRGEEDRAAAELVRRAGGPGTSLLVANKIDLVEGDPDETAARAAAELSFPGPRLAVSAATGQGVDELRGWVIERLAPGPRYFPEDMPTDLSEDSVLAEMVREQVLRQVGDEVPHETAVVVEENGPRPGGRRYVRAAVVVARESQKGIIIGAGGRRLKEIGRAARAGIESLLGQPVYLDLWVKVEKDWRRSAARLREYGYGAE
ncbi:MAG: GTPase Era [Bacteroidota bacterium]